MTRRLLSLAFIASLIVGCNETATDPGSEIDEAAFRRSRSMTEVDQSPVYKDFSGINDRLRKSGLGIQLG